jgi:hypothetical protein
VEREHSRVARAPDELDSRHVDRSGCLPILRVKFTDPAGTWIYIDPEMSQVLASIHRLNRLERWLYNGLHGRVFLRAGRRVDRSVRLQPDQAGTSRHASRPQE